MGDKHMRRRTHWFRSSIACATIAAFSPATSAQTRLIHNVAPRVSPDGTRIVFQSDRSGRKEIWAMAADGSRPRQLTK
jgi:hypothetical protein